MTAPLIAPERPMDHRSARHGTKGRASRFQGLPSALLASASMLLIAACAGSAASPSIAPASPSPSSAESPSGAASPGGGAACSADAIVATAAPWGGAAGSRGTDVTLVNHGATACVLPAGPQVAVVDSGGNVLAQSRQPTGTGGTTVQPNQAVAFSVLFGNWCNQSVSLPLRVRLALTSGAVDIAGSSLPTMADLPPCNGPGEPPSLSATEWQPQ